MVVLIVAKGSLLSFNETGNLGWAVLSIIAGVAVSMLYQMLRDLL